MEISSEQADELRELLASPAVSADVALRARIVLWSAEGWRRKDIAELAGVVPRTVDRCNEVPPCSWTAGGYAAGVRSCVARALVSSGVT
ncbi:helix-turn-helix domain-containing protein [Actinacidiphila glaucinigra]|uniref:helix-turn-helix domain-containing protein n=1 Tax=Actinacidiphila glaucinigra TaxID=235986 RepID=UPI003D8D24B2